MIVTVIVVAMLALVGVALMQSTSADRAASRSAANILRARLAAEAGLADFQAMLARVVASGDFAVVTLDDGANSQITALVKPEANGAVQVRVYPLRSDKNNTTGFLATDAPFNSANILSAVNVGVGSVTNLNQAFLRFGGIDWPAANADALILGAQFVANAVNADGTPSAEFAYVVADDCARLNLAIAGVNYDAGASRAKPLPSEFAGEIAVHGVGPHTLTADEYSKFAQLPDGVRSGVVVPSVFNSTNERKGKAPFYTTHQGQVFDLIPAGYFDDQRMNFTTYADAGRSKYDLNYMATQDANDPTANAYRIADVIAANLPSFRLRDPAFANDAKMPADPELHYNRRISAAIVDYIDADSTPTALTDGEPAGKEAMAYPLQVAERYDWVSTEPVSPTSATITVRQTVFVELWNPYTVQVMGNFKFELETLRQIEPAFASLPQLAGNIAVNMGPNEIKTYLIGSQDVSFLVTGENPLATPLILQQTSSVDINQPKHSNFRAFWNDELFDQTSSYNTILFDGRASGLQKAEQVLMPPNPVWSVNTGQTRKTASGYRSVNDPRQNHINNYVWENRSYANASTRWNGANDWDAAATATHKFETTWAKRDGFRSALNIGGIAGPNMDPTLVPSTYNADIHSHNAPAFVRNQPMDTVAELGHIYDPVHLDDSGVNTYGGEPDSYYSAGGGRTLRVGQPEPANHPTLCCGGQRAMNLLDIFTVRPVGQEADAPRLAGLNVNTAPVDVLAALFYDLQPVSDEGVVAGSKISLEGANNIADAVVNGRPYYSASDMHRFLDELANKRANYSPEIAGIANSTTPNMHDRAREELFRRAYNSLDTKSGAFRYYGLGRALDPAGNILSTVVLEAWVELRAATGNGGNVYLRPVVTQRKFL